mmetsp:Transcript_1598/g.1831  ORF Transcript_1598/g.1831 Transcript_1598/m.1831 type:complete len:144 (+) Transcript_1598:120-551(+)
MFDSIFYSSLFWQTQTEVRFCLIVASVIFAVILLLDLGIQNTDGEPRNDPWIRKDKFEHALACFCIQLCLSTVISLVFHIKWPVIYATLATVLIGVGKEVIDGERASLRDFAADMIGIMLELAMIVLVKNRMFTASATLNSLR